MTRASTFKTATSFVLAGILTAGGLAVPAQAQYDRNQSGYYRGYQRQRPYDDNYDRQRYNDQQQHRGGIGPGKGALIGAGGGALLGGLLGGGLKGALIGGSIGAAGGAIVGQSAQSRRDNRDYRERYDRDGRPY